MKKTILTLVVAVATLSFSTAFASGSLTPECPLKVMKKSQRLENDGTRFIPEGMKIDTSSELGDSVHRAK